MNGDYRERVSEHMIAPTYYRSLLTPTEQDLYKMIVNCLIRFENIISVRHSVYECEAFQRVIRAVHLDHPELFYVDFWRYRLVQNIFPAVTKIEFRLLLDRITAESVTNTLSLRAADLRKEIERKMSVEKQYYQVINRISKTITYVDSGSAFWDHTCAAVLRGTAVCEGIAKLFLYYCQRNQLPCAVVSGTLNGSPHAWNMVETDAGIRYVDVTGLLSSASLYILHPIALFKTEVQLHQNGYNWLVP